MDFDNFSFVDVETTGSNAACGRIIEIGILRMEKGSLVAKFQSLVNPQMRINPFIEGLTGINQIELDNAPKFSEIKKTILKLLKESVFVAHNVRFDYSFIRSEFKRSETEFSQKQLCTVKLAKILYPGFRSYKLDSLIENLGISCKNRHRAFDDAEVLYHFFLKATKEIRKEKLMKALNSVMKRPTIPLGITEGEIDSLPEETGVYKFFGGNNALLYVGKSVNIRDRVFSHFSCDRLSSREKQIAGQIKRVEAVITTGELSALLLESELVKKYRPIFNRNNRDKNKIIALVKVVTKEGYYSIGIKSLLEIGVADLENVVGIFRSKRKIKDCFYALAPKYNLCYKLLGLENTEKYCFAYQLGRCFGACLGKENKLKYNLRFDKAFFHLKIKRWPFSGPVIVMEKDKDFQYYLFDKWCYLGNLKNDTEIEEIRNKEYIFDYDTYIIIRKYLNKARNLKNIRTL